MGDGFAVQPDEVACVTHAATGKNAELEWECVSIESLPKRKPVDWGRP